MQNDYLIPEWHAPSHVRAYVTTRQCEHTLRLPSEPLWLNQVHGNAVICADKINVGKSLKEADGLYTRKSNIVCAIRTADCLPVFMTDTFGHSVAVVHAGWRGLSKNIIEKALKKLVLSSKNIKPKDILVWLGPAIGPAVYEVGEEVHDSFLEYPGAFRRISEKKWLANIYMIAREQLHKEGVKDIHGGEECTYTHDKLFYSARRDNYQTGRMVSLIWKE